MISQLLLIWNLAWAGPAPEITASLSQPEVRPGDTVELTISVKTDEEVSVETPTWSKPVNLNNEGLQTQTSFESHLRPGPNGMQFEKKRSIDFIYTLRPMRAGKIKLGPFLVKVDGHTFSLGALSLGVNAAAAQPPRQQGLGGRGLLPPGFEDEEDALFGQMLRRQRQQEKEIPSRELPINEKEAFFILVETDKKEAYEGEQIFASWYIFTRGNIHQFDRLKFPALKGFWKEDVEPAPTLNFEKEIVNGVLYHRALLASYALFPIKEGLTTIDEYKIRAIVSLPSSSFGGFSFGQPYTYTRTSKPLKIQVKPLPMEGRPDTFSGAVGNYTVQASVDNQTFVQGQPFTLRLRFDGDGNAKMIDLPKIQWPEDFELYDSKSESRFFQSGKSFKEFTLLVIPKKSGVVKLPPFDFSYFDPNSGSYKKIQTQEIALQVAPGVVQKGDSSRMKLENKKENEAVLTLPPVLRKASQKKFYWLSGWPMVGAWVFLYGALGILFIVFNWWWLRRLKFRKNLMDELKDRRTKWELALKENQWAAAATEVINAVYFLLSRLVEDGELTKDVTSLLDQLPPSIRGEVAQPLKKELEIMQLVAFAPEDAWKRFAHDGEFKKHVDQAYQVLEKTVRLSEEGASVVGMPS